VTKRTLLVPLALLTACGTGADTRPDTRPSPSVTVVGDTAFLELPVGRSADNGEITVAFDAVTEDSRCPGDVQCLWAGNAGIRLALTGGDEAEVVIVNSTLDPRQVSFAGYTIGYRDLRPYPVSDQPTDRGEYVATIAVIGALR